MNSPSPASVCVILTDVLSVHPSPESAWTGTAQGVVLAGQSLGVIMIAVCHTRKHLIKLANRKGIYYKGLDILKPGVIVQPSLLLLY